MARKTNTTRTNTVPKIAIRTGALNRGESEGSERAVKRSNIDKKNNSNNKIMKIMIAIIIMVLMILMIIIR